MIKYILLLVMGVLLAQMFITAMAVWIQQSKNPNINWIKAMKLYVAANSGRYILVAVLILILCFVLSDWMDLSLTHDDLIKKGIASLSRAEKIQLQFKTYTIGIGSFIEVIAVVFYKTGFKQIIDFGKSKGIDTNDINPSV